MKGCGIGVGFLGLVTELVRIVKELPEIEMSDGKGNKQFFLLNSVLFKNPVTQSSFLSKADFVLISAKMTTLLKETRTA